MTPSKRPQRERTELEQWLDDPDMADRFKLARRFGAASRAHFKGRPHNPHMVIDAAMAAVQQSLRDLPPDDRAEAIQKMILNRLDLILDYLEAIEAPTVGNA